MRVYESWPVLGEENEIYDDVVHCLEERVRTQVGITIKCVTDINNIPFEGAIGYCEHYVVPYLSQPKNPKGLSIIDTKRKRIIHDAIGHNFNDQRDSIVYRYPEEHYVKGTYEELLKYFIAQGYAQHNFDFKTAQRRLLHFRDCAKIPII